MAKTTVHGRQIRDLTIDLTKLESPFIGTVSGNGDWDITGGNNDGTITGIPNPVNPDDVVNKDYVDAALVGWHWKDPARVATTANLSLATDLEAGDVVDGVTLVAGDLVLVKDQTTGAENGVYVVQSSGAAVRDTDWPVGAAAANYTLFVSEGTCADAAFTVTNDGGSDVINTDTLAFAKLQFGIPTETCVFGECPPVTGGSPTQTLANTSIKADSQRVYLNGVRLKEGALDDYTIVDATGVITHCANLEAGDQVVVDYCF